MTSQASPRASPPAAPRAAPRASRPQTVGPGQPGWLLGLRPRPVLGVTRSRTDRVIAGVAAGVGDRLRIDPVLVRLAAVALTAAGGFGAGLYLLAWLFVAEADPDESAPAAIVPNLQRAAGFGLFVLGVLVFLREVGLWFGDPLSWPVAVAALGSAVMWSRGGGRRGAFARIAGLRVALGALLVILGTYAFLDAVVAAVDVGTWFLMIAVVVGGVGLLLAPSIWRHARQAGDERRERIRSEERAALAAHLHDSVLQTLAMIQRAPTTAEMVTLARGQERELRAWLYGQAGRGGPETLGVALNEIAGRTERLQHVPVEVVLVGDITLDARVRALVDACAEAVHNAVRHSGAGLVAVYAEVAEGAVTAFVRDEGTGFSPADVPPDRHGIAVSIVGRMQRHGGRATVSSAPDEGTEVELWLPLE